MSRSDWVRRLGGLGSALRQAERKEVVVGGCIDREAGRVCRSNQRLGTRACYSHHRLGPTWLRFHIPSLHVMGAPSDGLALISVLSHGRLPLDSARARDVGDSVIDLFCEPGVWGEFHPRK